MFWLNAIVLIFITINKQDVIYIFVKRNVSPGWRPFSEETNMKLAVCPPTGVPGF